jgi:hypothetical protein
MRKKVTVHVVYSLKDNSLDSGDLRQVTVEADSMHKGEVEQAVADKHGVSYFNVDAKNWRAV